MNARRRDEVVGQNSWMEARPVPNWISRLSLHDRTFSRM